MSHVLSCLNLQLRVPGRLLCPAVTLAIAPGQLWAVLGPNGSGKTTLLHALAGLADHAEDSVCLNGRAMSPQASRQRAREIGLLLQQEEGEFWGSVMDYVLLGCYPHARSWPGWSGEDQDTARAALAALGLSSLADRRLVTLSGGERQRARIAQVVTQSPRFMLLDEPLQHLDVKHQAQALKLFRSLVQDSARAVAMVLHDALWAGRHCTHALLLYDSGESMAGPAQAVLNRSNLERLYGCGLAELNYGGKGSYFVPNV